MRAKSPKRGRPKVPPMIPDQLPEVLAVRPPEACRLLGVGPTTFWKWVKRGDIRPVRVGPNITMIPMAELRDFLKRNASPSPDYSNAVE